MRRKVDAEGDEPGARDRSLWGPMRTRACAVLRTARAAGPALGAEAKWAAGDRAALLADTELVDQAVIALLVLALQVVEQSPALAHQHHEPPTGVVVLGVGLEVLRQVV